MQGSENRMRWVGAVIAVAVAAAFGCSSATAAAADPVYGISVAKPPSTKDLSKIKQGGVNEIRLQISWKRTKGKGGSLNWSRTDAAVRRAAQSGIEVVPYLTGTPPWMSCKKKCNGTAKAPSDSDGWLRFVTAAVERYGPGGSLWPVTQGSSQVSNPIETWQIWNTANQGGSHVRSSPRSYGVLLDATYRAIKLADPGAEVLTGALSFGHGKRGTKPTKFLKQLLHTDEGQSFSGLAVSPMAGSVGSLKSQIRALRKMLDANQLSGRGIWVTPVGWASDRHSSKKLSVGTAGQKKRLSQAFKALRSGFGVDGVFWSRWRDGGKGCSWCRHSGLLKRGGKAKPAWGAFKAFAKTLTGPPPPPPPSEDASFFGVMPDGGTITSADLAFMDAAGVGTVRFVIYWQAVQPTVGGPYNWNAVDGEFRKLALHGIEPLPVLYGDKDVVTDVENQTTMNRWKAFAAAAVNRYEPGGTFWTKFTADHPSVPALPPDIWQVYNEENAHEFWPSGPSGNKYAQLLHYSAEAIRGADPSAQIMLGGMFEDVGNGVKGDEFLQQIYNYCLPNGGSCDIEDDFDLVAVHPYSFDLEGISEQIEKLRAVMGSNGDGSVPIWVTEMGWGSEQSDREMPLWWERTPEGQAQMLTSAWNLLFDNRETWNIGGIVWYTWRDPTGDNCNFCKSAGLLEENYVPKPSYDAFSDLAHAGLPG
jgi:Glycosyl hydrolase catalytic core